MNLATALNGADPAILDVLADAILRTTNPAETVEALYAFACDLEGAYPGCDPRVDLDDLRACAARDHRLDEVVEVLETP